MFQKRKRTCKRERAYKRVGMVFFTLILFFQQSMFLTAKEPEIIGEVEGTEQIEESQEERSEESAQDEMLFPYYDNMEELVEGIRESLATSEENFTIYVSTSLTESEEFDGLGKKIFSGVRDGNYYSATVYGISVSISNLDDITVKKLNVRVKRTDSKEEQAIVLKKVKEIAGEIEKNAGCDYEKTKMAHDYLVENIEYVTGYHGAYSALCEGKAVCNGYAAAFQLIMDELGIPCKTVSSDEINHMWNCVYLEGFWYNVDVTWDDAAGKTEKIDYRYFLKSQEDFFGHGSVSFSTAEKSFVQNVSSKEYENGWKQEGKYRYYYMNGKLVTGWLLEQGKWYYFKEDGVMQTGWIKNGELWYYFGTDGTLKTFFISFAGLLDK